MNPVRLITGAILAVVVTFGLFSLMVTLIAMGDAKLDKTEGRKIVDITMPDTDIDQNVKERKPEKPDEPEPEPDAPPPPEFDTPDVNPDAVNTNVGGVKVGGGAGFSLDAADGEYLPLVRVQPQYPRRAQSRGLEGSVIVTVDVLPTGQTENCRASQGVTSKGNPTTMWDRAACKAAAKFKYKPRVVDGKPVRVNGVPYKFTFEMSE